MLKTEQGVQSLAIVLLSLLGAVLLSEASRSPNIVLVSTFSVSQASISNSAMSNDLAAFLRDSKRDFLAALQDEHKQEWVLVMGNESGGQHCFQSVSTDKLKAFCRSGLCRFCNSIRLSLVTAVRQT